MALVHATNDHIRVKLVEQEGVAQVGSVLVGDIVEQVYVDGVDGKTTSEASAQRNYDRALRC